ncbi:TM0106 family RecB-like putative nuclease [Gordonia sp. NB41Y]|uniref:TM0106 family RecB-like putative nuclease n=1 Tax=Gordonia sp. NB41Y TaxID=875808 RepID=UPI0021CA0072|nr:TM0106 family RecB-like putative nuclease [Gordonia sp. NB41Y]WLP92789.1 TM0106 family RecB-like putative nuclease [Gordonia sp. NB41Y]
MAVPMLHPRDLAGCEHRLALDVAHPDLVRDRPQPPDVARRTEAAGRHRDRVRDLLASMHTDQPGAFVVIDPGPTPQRAEATLAACAAGAEWIWNATLPTDRAAGRRGHSELLVRVDGGYLPVIVVNHRVSYPAKTRRDLAGEPTVFRTSPLWGWVPTPDPYRVGRNHRRDQLRLAQLTHMLLDAGLAAADDEEQLRAGVIGLDADCIVVHRMQPLLDDYRTVFERRQAIAAGRLVTTPRRIGECRSCVWWGRCGPELAERRDISLVAAGNQADALAEIGLTTIDQLAHHRGPAPVNWPGNVAFDDAIVNAIAWLTDTPLIRRHERPQVARADVEVDVDMESFGEDGAYLWGTLLTDNVDPDRPVVYRAFATWDPLPTRDEARSFAEFWRWLMAERRQAHEAGKTFAAYCYSQQAENRWLLGSADRFAGAPGIPRRKEVEAFIGSAEWVDIYEAVGTNFICPQGKGLKKIAPVAGFTWRDAEAGGAASMDWYRAAVGIGDAVLDLTQRDRLLEYNEDDVQATKVLREWMDSADVLRLPTAAELLAFRGADDADVVDSAENDSPATDPAATAGSGAVDSDAQDSDARDSDAGDAAVTGSVVPDSEAGGAQRVEERAAADEGQRAE